MRRPQFCIILGREFLAQTVVVDQIASDDDRAHDVHIGLLPDIRPLDAAKTRQNPLLFDRIDPIGYESLAGAYLEYVVLQADYVIRKAVAVFHLDETASRRLDEIYDRVLAVLQDLGVAKQRHILLVALQPGYACRDRLCRQIIRSTYRQQRRKGRYES